MKKSKSLLTLLLRVAFVTLASVVLFRLYPIVIKLFVPFEGKTTKFTYIGISGSWNYYVYTPKGYSIISKVPLVVVIHGCTETASIIAADSKFNEKADKEKFIVVYPEQSFLANELMCWNWFHPANQIRGLGEPGAIAGIVQTVQKSLLWNIDKDRTYVAGFSTGAAMTVILGVTYPDLFAAIGVESGFQFKSATTVGQALEQCLAHGPDPTQQGHVVHQAMGRYARRVPTIVFHGTADVVVPFVHGQEVVISMAVANSLADPSFNNTDFFAPSTVVNRQIPLGHEYTVKSWDDIHGKPVIQFYRVEHMNHAWSGGALPFIDGADIFPDPRGPCYTDIAYKFFMDNPMNAAAAVTNDQHVEDVGAQLVLDY